VRVVAFCCRVLAVSGVGFRLALSLAVSAADFLSCRVE